jgi:hypothetical protein
VLPTVVQCSRRPRIAAPQVHGSEFTVHSPHFIVHTLQRTATHSCWTAMPFLLNMCHPEDSFRHGLRNGYSQRRLLSHHSTPSRRHLSIRKCGGCTALSRSAQTVSFGILDPRPPSLDNAFKGISWLRVRKLASSSPPVRGAWPTATNHWSNSCSC